uniref:VHS domain-containing protein n=1 Tax=Kwoniella pini CBS 10737 TaxID=1296096 RepID=A0A1B9HWQ3_9TREE|nr:uncharacterized protein I206_06610 [Kwoniella pini CBS 10737]OCF47704.1 hypothetical protein I206_06610 [Kwoniella pini CBS 10737]
MKRLFRTSKSPVVDPLPPPISTPASGTSTPTNHHQEHRWPFGHSHQPEVTPFPIDAGRENASTLPPLSNEARKGKQRGPSGGNNPNAPSLLEIRQMQDRDQAMRSVQTHHHQHQNQHLHQHQPHQSKGYGGSNASASDEWTVISPSNSHIPIPSPGSNGHGRNQMYDSSLFEPLAIPNAAFATSPTPSNNDPSSVSTHTVLYLPPGARPATPPSMRPPPLGSARNSQASLNSMSTAHYGEAGDIISPPSNNVGRERGHSVVSATGNNTNMNQTIPTNAPTQSSKLQKAYPQPTRSPLANTYPSPELTSFPSPHPYSLPPPPPPTTQNLNGFNPMVPRAEEMPNVVNLSRRGSQMEGKEKKRGFLGMGWGKGKDKEKKDTGDVNRPITEEPRRSFDGWRGQTVSGETESQPSSTHGHSTSHEQEDAPRGRLLGLDFGGGGKQQQQHQQQQPNDAGSAIRWLCAQPDPPPSQIYDVCDRIHKSQGMEGITKDAARAIRKEFKGGNENERKNAAKVWLYLMRNVSVKGFRQHASSKKFLSSLEPILLAPASKPLVSQPTYKLITDILSDLTFSYGLEKGCEGLAELWKKVKLPQESEIGNPLPADHPIFSPEPFYPQRQAYHYASPDQSFPSSRRASSPSLQYLSANHQDIPNGDQRGPSPNYGGPRYANLPNHGEDIRRLVDECTAAKESARVLSEALIFTGPDELEQKPVIGEFYRKVFLAHESLTNQMDWAQAEAARSRESHAALTLNGNSDTDNTKHDTPEEQALATLLEAHSALGEALKQHDDLTRLAGEENEMREVRERSKKETKLDRNVRLLPPSSNQAQASSSRSPSPVPHARLPPDNTLKVTSSPRNYDLPLPPLSNGTAALPIPGSNNPFRNAIKSRTPSPDQRHPLPQLPKLSSSPSRTSSPLGRSRMGGPRPLPNPFAKGNNASHQSLANLANSAHVGSEGGNIPSRNGSGDTPSRSGTGDSSSQGAHVPAEEVDGDDLPPKPIKPSRKALGKRRAVIDEDNNFNPDDMFNPNHTDPRSINRDGGQGNPNSNNNENENDSSEEDYITLLDDKTKIKPKIVYAYDAYEERQLELKKAAQALKISEKYGGGGGGGSGGGRV